MRSVLLFSADRRRSFVDALSSGASAILLRPGDAAGMTRAEALAWARGLIEAARKRAERPRLLVEIAPLRDPAAEEELAALVIPGLDGVMLGGCEGRADVQQLSVRLSALEAAADMPAGAVKIIALAAQTPAGVFALTGYAGASSRLAALAMDETPLPGGAAARATARTLLALAAAASGARALDAAPPARGSALEEACRAIRRDGFCGLMTASAGDIPVINRAFVAA
ncbi:MAG: aldolase/citrate lyase family protein [Methylocystis sp.]|uniref:aldolase/citrate lyase family protein n=1 Tax=Methylocystis sp. TaxID=1911079 RepID=UPI003DA4A085